jgi:UDP-N-acetylmuramyl pentapeptide phosphotransferase/UDP-N-acetylglucosamine-1-phosphate transferase
VSDLAAPLVAVGTAAAVGAVVAALLLRCAGSLPHDRPNARSLHLRPVPRVGGLAVWAGAVAGWAAGVAATAAATGTAEPFAGSGTVGAVALALAAVAAVSLADDWRGLPARVRLSVHLLAGLAAAAAILPDAGWPLHCALAVTLAWAANLYNFMDGSDGLAASMAVCGFGALAGGAALGAGPGGWLAPAAAAIAGGAIALLAFNAPPARLFMGDVGSVPLGFAAAALGALGVALGRWPPWFPLLVFLPFVADATVTLARRALAGERVFEAHRGHYYQRLWQMGAGHRGTLAVYAALAAATASTALGMLAWFPRYGPLALAAWIAIIAAGFAGIDYHWRLHCTKSR